MTGSLCVPNVGLGDIQITFNQHDDAEVERAMKMLADMQARGYAILVQLGDGTYARVERIDHRVGRYILTLPDDHLLPPGAEIIDAPVAQKALPPANGLDDGVPLPKKRGRPRKVGIPIARAHATGIARSAGG